MKNLGAWGFGLVFGVPLAVIMWAMALQALRMTVCK